MNNKVIILMEAESERCYKCDHLIISNHVILFLSDPPAPPSGVTSQNNQNNMSVSVPNLSSTREVVAGLMESFPNLMRRSGSNGSTGSTTLSGRGSSNFTSSFVRFPLSHGLSSSKYCSVIFMQMPSWIYSVSPSPGGDVACLFAKRSSKSPVQSEIARPAHARTHVYKLRLHAYVNARRWRDGV